MKFDFARNKYQKELLIDCFERQVAASNSDAQNPFLITFYEVIFITNGSGVFKLDNEGIPFKPGTVLLLPPNKWRQWQLSSDIKAIYLIFEEEFISQFFNDSLYLFRFNYFYNTNTPSCIKLPLKVLEEIEQKLSEVQIEIKHLKPDSSHLLRALLYYILIGLNRTYQEQWGMDKSFYKETKILKFRKLLETNIHTKQRVSQYAALLRISTSHLNTLTKTYLGKNASELIKERLVLEIKKRLLFSDKSISEIAYDLGFSEPSNFNRFFIKRAELSPKEFRLQNDKS